MIRSWGFTLFMYAFAVCIGLLGWVTLFNRRWSMAVCTFWCRGTLWALKTLCGVTASVSGEENLPDGPAIIAGKHQAMWETVFFCAYFEGPSFVLKKQLKSIPVFGWWCARAGFIYIDRDGGAKALRQMVDDSKAALANGATHIIIFPEGTRTGVGQKAPYQPGIAALAKTLKLPVVPAAHNSGCHWQHPGPLKVPGTIYLEFLPALDPSLPRAKLMAQLEETVESATARLEAKGGYHRPAPASAPLATES
ncbi:MAG: lysophospholipid acyltransferase family protein [Pseudomonadota bacterium]